MRPTWAIQFVPYSSQDTLCVREEKKEVDCRLLVALVKKAVRENARGPIR